MFSNLDSEGMFVLSAPIPAIYVLRGLQMRLRCVYDDGCASLISKIVDFGRNPRKIILKMFSNPDPEGIFVVSAPILVIYELPRVFGAFCMTPHRLITIFMLRCLFVVSSLSLCCLCVSAHPQPPSATPSLEPRSQP